MRILVDAMGSDDRPTPDVTGAVMAARELPNVSIALVGDRRRVENELAKHDVAGLNIAVHDAAHEISMDDKPSDILKSKPGSSIHVGLKLLEEKHVDAFVSMGNTGAIHAAATLHAPRRIRGVKRPALTAVFPVNNQPVVFLDVGANADCKAEWMIQFAIMGEIYAHSALGLAKPRVGLLSNGEEEGKGNALIRETAEALQTLPVNFIGNIEPKELFLNKADVIVMDGFTGNILMKTFEASSRYLTAIMREEIKRNPISTVGGLLIKPALKHVKRRMDTAEVGGAPLLGVQGVVIIGHGSSSAYGVKNAVHQAYKAVSGHTIEQITEQLAKHTVS